MSGIANSSFPFAESKAKAVHIEENMPEKSKYMLKVDLCLIQRTGS